MKKTLRKPMKSFDAVLTYVTAYGGESCTGVLCGFNW